MNRLQVQNLNLEELLDANKEKIYRICRIYAVTPLEPADLFQEVLFQIWKSLPGFKGNSSINTWVYRIALNVCMRSKLKLEKTTSKTVRFEGIQFKMGVQGERDDEDEQKYRLLKECIGSLNEADSAIIILYLEALTYREISEVTGLTENYVAVKMKRIRQKLFNCMDPKLK